jgi:hypothetical protein
MGITLQAITTVFRCKPKSLPVLPLPWSVPLLRQVACRYIAEKAFAFFNLGEHRENADAARGILVLGGNIAYIQILTGIRT